jgi:hypothetical protein
MSFNPQPVISTDRILDSLGSFYNNLDEATKTTLKEY